MSALSCLVSCGILRKDEYLAGRVRIANMAALDAKENNALSFMSLMSKHMPLTGVDGLKERTRLLEFKYDAK